MVDMGLIIDEYLAREDKPRKVGSYYISEVPYCIRKNWFSYKQPKETDKPTRRVFARGIIIHDWITHILGQSKKVKFLMSERSLVIPVAPNILLRGRLDNFIVTEDEGGEKTVLEIKTTANINFVDKPNLWHIEQLIPYLLIEECKGKLLYVDSRNLSTKEFTVEFDEKIMEKLVNRAKELDKHLRENKVPLAEAKTNPDMKWECGYCAWRENCDKIERGNVNGGR